VSKVGGKMMALDLTLESVRNSIRYNDEAIPDLYERVGVEY